MVFLRFGYSVPVIYFWWQLFCEPITRATIPTKIFRILLQHDYLSSLKSTRKRKMHHVNLVRMSCNRNLVSLEVPILSSTGITQFGIDSHIDKNFGFINGVDNVNWPPYRDSKS